VITEEPLAHGHTNRHVRSAVTMVVLVLLVLGAAWFGWRAVTGSSDAGATTAGVDPVATECGAAPVAVTPPELQVNVYNGTSRSGLARSTAGQVTAAGFVVLAVDNDPRGERVTDVAVVRGATGSANAYLLMAYVPGSRFVADERTDATLDLVTGDQFTQLVAPPAPPAPVLMC
jgi:hypothetical protein